MSRLRDRLLRLSSNGSANVRVLDDDEHEVDAETGEFRERSFTRDHWGAAPVDRFVDVSDDVLPGERCATALGELRALLTCFDSDHRHGAVPPASALRACARDIALLALDQSLSTLDLSRALYLDTETTGLLGGTGTIPFLIGMAWFEGETLHVEQLFLERPGEEGPMLQRLSERVAQASVVVSFNGKSFDWPLLRTRFILQRMPAPSLPPHLDLLHCARRVYKRRLGSVRLTALEREVLGFERIDDIDGAQIPELYLGYLRGRVAKRALVPILDHNRADLVALPALLGEIARRFKGEGPTADARDALGFAGVSARAGGLGFEHGHAHALAFAAHSLALDLRGELAPEAHFFTGELHRKKGDLDAAVHAYQASIEAACRADFVSARAHLALAKLYEHKLADPARALEHAARTAPAEDPESAEKRCARLRTKLGRSPRDAAI